jgi:hypothetical protein
MTNVIVVGVVLGVRMTGTIGDLPSRCIERSAAGATFGRIWFIERNLVRHPKLFQEPKDSLRTRLIEMMDDDYLPLGLGPTARPCFLRAIVIVRQGHHILPPYATAASKDD